MQTAALATGGLLLSFFVPPKSLAGVAHTPGFSPNALLRIDPDDTIHIVLNKVEMGQGIWTTLAMLIAEELDCDWARIRVEHRVIEGPHLDESMWVLSTGGSDTTRSEFDRYRTTGAIARTATSIRNGGSSPLAGVTHSITLVLVIVLLAPLARNVPLAALANPSLTTVRIPGDELGLRAFQALHEMLESRRRSGTESVLHTELVVRESSRP